MRANYLLIPVLATFGLSAFAGGAGCGDRFDKADANADGFLSAEELGANKAREIEEMDLDGDQLISRDEYTLHKASKKRADDRA